MLARGKLERTANSVIIYSRVVLRRRPAPAAAVQAEGSRKEGDVGLGGCEIDSFAVGATEARLYRTTYK